MKHLLTAIACFFALSMSAQFPYNPDSNSDNLVGIDDLMGLLSLFGGDFLPSYEIEKQVCAGPDTCFVNESTNWLEFTPVYPVIPNHKNVIVLPINMSWKKLFVATQMWTAGQIIKFQFDSESRDITPVDLNGKTAITFIRDDNGQWWFEM